MSRAESSAKTLASKALGKAARRSAMIPPAREKHIADLRAQLEGARGAAQEFAAKAALPDAELLRIVREENLLMESICMGRVEMLRCQLQAACGAPVSHEGGRS